MKWSLENKLNLNNSVWLPFMGIAGGGFHLATQIRSEDIVVGEECQDARYMTSKYMLNGMGIRGNMKKYEQIKGVFSKLGLFKCWACVTSNFTYGVAASWSLRSACAQIFSQKKRV